MPNPQFWKSKRVLITGHTGFKGSWLSIWLQRLGAEVIGYALAPPTDPSLFELAEVAQGMASVQGDIRDLDRVARVFAQHRPEIVIHMAAQSLVRASYAAPVENYAVNVMGTVNVLEATRHAPDVRVFVNVTSDKCYENQGLERGYREDDPMGGFDPYSSSKGCSELITSAYRRSFFGERVALASARAGNVIGGGDWAQDRLVPDIIKAFIEGSPVRIRNPHAIRPWQHVLEPLSGYLRLAERLWDQADHFSEGWNFGPHESDARPVSWIVDRMAQVWGGDVSWEFDSGPHFPEAASLKLDCSKSTLKLGWRPRTHLTEALDWTVGWFLGFQRGHDVRTLTEADIKRFVAMEG